MPRLKTEASRHHVVDADIYLPARVPLLARQPFLEAQEVTHGKAPVVLAKLKGLVAPVDCVKKVGPCLEVVRRQFSLTYFLNTFTITQHHPGPAVAIVPRITIDIP